jgi:hypothetical protein
MGRLKVFIVVRSFKEWERNTGERTEGDKGTKMVRERTKGGKIRRYEINQPLLNFNETFPLVHFIKVGQNEGDLVMKLRNLLQNSTR